MGNSINQLIAKNISIFLKALSQVNQAQIPENKIHFEKEVLETIISSELGNRLNFYLNYQDSKLIPSCDLNDSYSKYFESKNVKKREGYIHTTQGFLAFLTQKMKNNYHLLKLRFRSQLGISLKNLAFINTPHPIGNLSASHGILLDFINQINCFYLSQSIIPNPNFRYKKKDRSYSSSFWLKLTKSLKLYGYTAFIFRQFYHKNILNMNYLKMGFGMNLLLQSTKQREIKYLKKLQKQILSEDLFTKKELEKCKNLDNLLELLASEFVNIGLDIKVISKVQQTQDANRKIQHLRGNNSATIDKNWDKVDADGDHLNAITEVLGEKIIGKTFIEIYQNSLKAEKNPTQIAFEPRISCKEKRNVEGIIIALSKISGVNEIKSIDDLLNHKIFDEKYQKFQKFLETEKYGKETINSKLDIILRISLANFVNSKGFVLSDFPYQNAEELLAQLLFVEKSVNLFLKQNSAIFLTNFEKKSQKLLALCENKVAIYNFTKVIEVILGKIITQAKFILNCGDLKNQTSFDKNYLRQTIGAPPCGDPQNQTSFDVLNNKNQQLLELKEAFSDDGELVFGAFFGPSDLTSDIGGMSIAVINNKKCELAQIYAKFQDDIREIINLDDVGLIQEYGKGSSPIRGANLAFNHPRTIQGQALSSTDTFLQKTYVQHSIGETSILNIPKHILDRSIENHRYFINNNGENLGKIAKEYDEIIETQKGQNLMFPTTKDYSNNQGTRGKSGLVKFENQRAIGLTTLKNYFGLLQAPAFPYDKSSNKIDEWGSDSFWDFINHPAGFTILMSELFQFCVADFSRAKILGFSDDLIDESSKYIWATLEFLKQKININTNSQNEFYQDIAEIIDALEKLNFIKSAYLKKRLELFSRQIPIIYKISNLLTKRVRRLSQSLTDASSNSEKQDFVAIATYLNLLANFQLPVVSASKELI